MFNSTNLTNTVRKMAKIRKRYNQVPHLTQDTTWVKWHLCSYYMSNLIKMYTPHTFCEDADASYNIA